LLAAGSDLVARDDLGDTPLHNAAGSYSGDADAIALELLPHNRSPTSPTTMAALRST